MVIAITRDKHISLFLCQALHALLAYEVILHPRLPTAGVDPQVGVGAVAVHVPPGPWMPRSPIR